MLMVMSQICIEYEKTGLPTAISKMLLIIKVSIVLLSLLADTALTHHALKKKASEGLAEWSSVAAVVVYRTVAMRQDRAGTAAPRAGGAGAACLCVPRRGWYSVSMF
jgi:hypothetical protein